MWTTRRKSFERVITISSVHCRNTPKSPADIPQDYIFPKGNRMDTAPNNEQGVDQELRNAQIELRLCELEEAYNVLKKICSGDGEEVARQNLRSEGFVGGSSRGLKGVNWQQWKTDFTSTR
jgi:platelet-activating factor acetylhydrolase